MIREIDGQPVMFVKSSSSHIDGKECLYVGAAGDTIELFESDTPATVVRTDKTKFAHFIEGAKQGEFDALL